MEEKKSIFRKKSLDRISSPEELDGYLTVTGPGVWLPLIAAVLLLIGCFVWMIFGQITTTLNVAVTASDGHAVCLVPMERLDAVMAHKTVEIADSTYKLSDAGFAPKIISEDTDVTIRNAGELRLGDAVVPLLLDDSLIDGVYSGRIVIETTHPISFIIN